MSNGKIYTGNVGTIIILDVGIDLSTATSLIINVRKPDGSQTTWTGGAYSIGGIMNYVRYVTTADDLNMAGTYSLQTQVVSPSFTGLSETVKIKVFSRFN